MTFEKKCTFEPSDIVAVHLECANCKAATIIPIGKIDRGVAATIAMGTCSHCNADFGFQHGTAEIQAFSKFTNALGTIAQHLEGRNLRLKLEVACPE